MKKGLTRAVTLVNYDEGDMIKMTNGLANTESHWRPVSANFDSASASGTHGLLKACKAVALSSRVIRY